MPDDTPSTPAHSIEAIAAYPDGTEVLAVEIDAEDQVIAAVRSAFDRGRTHTAQPTVNAEAELDDLVSLIDTAMQGAWEPGREYSDAPGEIAHALIAAGYRTTTAQPPGIAGGQSSFKPTHRVRGASGDGEWTLVRADGVEPQTYYDKDGNTIYAGIWFERKAVALATHPTPPVESPAPSNVSEYTPTTDEVRALFALQGAPRSHADRVADFDRWLGAVQNDARREVIEWVYSPNARFASANTALAYFDLDRKAGA